MWKEASADAADQLCLPRRRSPRGREAARYRRGVGSDRAAVVPRVSAARVRRHGAPGQGEADRCAGGADTTEHYEQHRREPGGDAAPPGMGSDRTPVAGAGLRNEPRRQAGEASTTGDRRCVPLRGRRRLQMAGPACGFPALEDGLGFMARWAASGVIGQIRGHLASRIRRDMGKGPRAVATVIGSQSVKAAETVSKATRGYRRSATVSLPVTCTPRRTPCSPTGMCQPGTSSHPDLPDTAYGDHSRGHAATSSGPGPSLDGPFEHSTRLSHHHEHASPPGARW